MTLRPLAAILSQVQQNVGITLAKLRMPRDAIRQAVLALDARRLGREQLEALLKARARERAYIFSPLFLSALSERLAALSLTECVCVPLSLYQAVPSAEDARVVAEYRGDPDGLGRVERFFREVCGPALSVSPFRG